jgi:peroxiredoxin
MPARKATLFALLLSLTLAAAAGALLPQGRKAPSFTLNTTDNGTVKLSQYLGKPVVLDFWAPWCAPCRRALPELQKLSARYQAKGLVVLGVAVDGDPRSIASTARQAGVRYPLLVDSAGNAGEAYQVAAIPTLYLVDKRGMIAFSEVGFAGPTALEAAIKKALR